MIKPILFYQNSQSAKLADGSTDHNYYYSVLFARKKEKKHEVYVVNILIDIEDQSLPTDQLMETFELDQTKLLFKALSIPNKMFTKHDRQVLMFDPDKKYTASSITKTLQSWNKTLKNPQT